MMIPYKILLAFLVALQVCGPSWVLAIQTSQGFSQEASEGQALLSGIRGVVTVIPGTKDRPGYAPEYRSALAIGDVITTEEESVAEILFEDQGLVSVQEYSEALLGKNAAGGPSLTLQVGEAEWSVPLHNNKQGSIPLTFITPNIRATTRGGLVTAKVQPTLSEIVRTSLPGQPSLIKTSLHAQSASGGGVGLSETFCVNEGSLTVEYPGSQPGAWEQKSVSTGECLGFLNGQPRALDTQNPSRMSDWRAVCTVGAHCEIPESAQELIVKKQMGQALALERALVGSGPEDGEVDEEVVLATTGLNTGLLLAANTPESGPGDGGNGGVILPTTGSDPPLNGDSNTPPPGGGTPPLPLPDSPGLNVGNMVPSPTPFRNIGSTGDGGTPPIPLPSNVQTGGSLWPPNGMPGGQGLLTFIRGDFTADKELLLADSGILASAPHLGKAPQNSLVVSDLSPNGVGSPSNQQLPLNVSAFGTRHHKRTFQDFNPSPTSNAQLGVEGTSRMEQSEQLAQFARSPIDPSNILASLPDTSAEFPCPFSALSCFEVILAAGLGALEKPDPKPESDAGVDASIQVRSALTGDRTVTLKKGVVAGGNTLVNLALQEKTNDSFSGLEATLGQAIQSSAVSILGEPGDPAIVEVQDRVLAILGDSRIQAADPMLTTALLTVLDGTLRGPVEPSVIGNDAAGGDILREGVSPIIEMIDSSAEVSTAVMIGSTANTGQTGDLDQALLEASSPLLAMMESSLTTASDFGRVAGQNAKLDATLLPGDALVRLNASDMMVNGNLFTVTGGGQLNIVNGSLLSVQAGSTVTLAGGVFVNVGPSSLFSLTNGSLVDFGMGNNVVNVSNSLCAGGGCFAPFANPAWQVAGNPADFSAPASFNPFVDLGTFPDGSVNTLNVGQGSAILSVAPGGTIQIQ